MPERYRLPRNVTGLTMRDGRKIDADARGVIEVPDRYAQNARDAAGDTLLLSRLDSQATFAGGVRHCQGCGFHAFSWTKVCPRCGEAIDREEEHGSDRA